MSVTSEVTNPKRGRYTSRPMGLFDNLAVKSFLLGDVFVLGAAVLDGMACRGASGTTTVGIIADVALGVFGVACAEIGKQGRLEFAPNGRTVQKPVRYAKISSGVILAGVLGYGALVPPAHDCSSLLRPDTHKSAKSFWPGFSNTSYTP